jgi:hypothetical protein
MKVRWKNMILFLTYIISPFIYVPIMNHYHVGHLSFDFINLVAIYFLIQPFLIVLPLWCLFTLFMILLPYLFDIKK